MQDLGLKIHVLEDESANGRAPSAAAADNRSLRGSRRELSSKSVDYSDMDAVRDSDTLRRRNRSNSEAENMAPNADTPTNQLLQEFKLFI
ncbi:hypothetical protein Avbf_07492 [Armadillidium vulgare]|nr:hypothetical protein Avbf_07492 [Armadillidium vulgare]